MRQPRRGCYHLLVVSSQQAGLGIFVVAKEFVARAQSDLARRKARLSAARRETATRRKILADALVLHLTEFSPPAAEKLRKGIDRHVAADRDRSLFDLPLLDGGEGKDRG